MPYRLHDTKESATYDNLTGRVYFNGNDGAHRRFQTALIATAGSSNGMSFYARINRKDQSGSNGQEWETAEFIYTDLGDFATRTTTRVSSSDNDPIPHLEESEALEVYGIWVEQREYIFPIYAEYSGTVVLNDYRGAFGDGHAGISTQGMPIHVPTGYESHVVAMGCGIGGGNVSMRLIVNGAQDSRTIRNVSGTNSAFTEALANPKQVYDNDVMGFQCQYVDTHTAPVRIVAWFRNRKIL